MVAHEEKLLRQVKSWMAKLPAPEIDILIVDEIGKNISGAGMDTKVINRGVNGEYNPWPDTPMVRRLYARGLSELSYHSAVGLGMADVIHDHLLNEDGLEADLHQFAHRFHSRLHSNPDSLFERSGRSIGYCADGRQDRSIRGHLLPDPQYSRTHPRSKSARILCLRSVPTPKRYRPHTPSNLT